MSDFPLSLVYLVQAETVGYVRIPKIQDNWQALVLVQNPEKIAWRGRALIEIAMRPEIAAFDTDAIDTVALVNEGIEQTLGDWAVYTTSHDVIDPYLVEAARRQGESEQADVVLSGEGDTMTKMLISVKFLKRAGGYPAKLLLDDPFQDATNFLEFLKEQGAKVIFAEQKFHSQDL